MGDSLSYLDNLLIFILPQINDGKVETLDDTSQNPVITI